MIFQGLINLLQILSEFELFRFCYDIFLIDFQVLLVCIQYMECYSSQSFYHFWVFLNIIICPFHCVYWRNRFKIYQPYFFCQISSVFIFPSFMVIFFKFSYFICQFRLVITQWTTIILLNIYPLQSIFFQMMAHQILNSEVFVRHNQMFLPTCIHYNLGFLILVLFLFFDSDMEKYFSLVCRQFFNNYHIPFFQFFGFKVDNLITTHNNYSISFLHNFYVTYSEIKVFFRCLAIQILREYNQLAKNLPFLLHNQQNVVYFFLVLASVLTKLTIYFPSDICLKCYRDLIMYDQFFSFRKLLSEHYLSLSSFDLYYQNLYPQIYKHSITLQKLPVYALFDQKIIKKFKGALQNNQLIQIMDEENNDNLQTTRAPLSMQKLEIPQCPAFCHRVLHKQELYIFPIGSQTNEVIITNITSGKMQRFDSIQRGAEQGGQQSIIVHKNMHSVVVDDVIYFCGRKEGNYENGYDLIGFNVMKRQWQEFPGIEANKMAEDERNDDGQGSTIIFCSFKNLYLVLIKVSDRKISDFLWIFDINQQFWDKCNNFLIPKMTNIKTCTFKKSIYIINKEDRQYNFRTEDRQIMKICMELQEQADGIPISFKESDCSLPLELDKYESLNHILPISDYQLLLLTQIKSNKSQNQAANTRKYVRIYDILSEKWGKLNCNLLDSIGNNFNYSYSQGKLLVFSNIQSHEVHKIQKNNLFESKINEIRYEKTKECQICNQVVNNKNQLMEPEFKVTAKMVDELIENMDFPFSAFGILADNCINYSATYMNVQFGRYNQEPFLKIQDDAKIIFSNEELEEILVNFQAMRCYNFSSVERRSRTVIFKESIRKQFGTNIKLAALRLGSEMLYISINNVLDVRVAYFTMENDQYVCYYYVQDMKTKRLHEDYSLEIRSLVENRFGDLMLTSLHADQNAKLPSHKNTLFIFGLKEVEDQKGNLVFELTPQTNTFSEGNDGQSTSYSSCDIVYISPNQSIYRENLAFGNRINQSIDVSLMSYFSHLYLKNEHLKISIQIDEGPRRYLNKQERYGNLDKSSWQKYVVPINECLGKFQFKQHFELFVNTNLGKKLGVFHNGVLIYNRNRLIGRLGGCKLGQLFSFIQMKPFVSYGYFNVFGSIQLPDSLEINQVKTDFLYPVMLEKFKSRINFIHQWAQQKFNLKQTNMHAPVKQGPKLRPRIAELDGPHNMPVKRSKRHNPDLESSF